MIRTLQDHGIHQGIEFHMEHTVTVLLKDGGRVDGRVRLRAGAGPLRGLPAGAVVLATGGIGRAFSITSNSWEYTGDGHALAYHAGADLIDMEFVQFHPTGMVWPPSVKGILVTEGVRGEGGVLRNSEGRRFMFDDIPANYKEQTADNEEEGWRYTQGDKDARRPPELLTRDHVARCIVREMREGRGSPHGGVFLDIAWIKERIPHAEEHIKKKLPSMYHQFKQLAGIDITKEPMEVGPTTHYMMGGVRVDPESQMSTVPGLFAAGECGRGSTAPTAWAATRCRTSWSSASARARTPRGSRRSTGAAGSTRPRWTPPPARPSSPSNAGAGSGEGPYAIQHELQGMMQDLVGIVRREPEMERALEELGRLRAGARRRRPRQPRVQPGLAHRPRPAQPADRLRGRHPGGPRPPRKPGGPLPRRLS